MKKFLALLMAMMMCFAVTACGGGETSDGAADSDETATEEAAETSDMTFHDNVYETDDLKIEITKYEVIQPGDTTYSEYNFEEQPVMAFWYKVTNKSGEDIDPMSAFIFNFKAIQDNDPNSVNELEVSSLPDETFLDSQTETIKKGGTVECCVGYLLDDEETPVTLVASDILGTESGSQDFPVK